MNLDISLLRKFISTLNAKSTSIDALSQRLNITSSEVLNIVKYLEDRGCVFVKKENILELQYPFHLLDDVSLQAQIKSKLYYFNEIDSTNSYLLKHKATLQSGDLCIAEYQEQARARRGKNWLSPYGCNLYFSMYWRLECSASESSGLSLVVGLMLSQTLRSLGVNDVGLKWPNDVYRDGKKLAGILVELMSRADGGVDVVIGIGLNIQMSRSQKEIEQPIHSLSDIVNESTTKTTIADLLWHNLFDALKKFEEHGFSFFQEMWLKHDLFLNKKVKLITDQEENIAIHRGVDEDGRLLLEINGVIVRHVSANVSLRLFVD